MPRAHTLSPGCSVPVLWHMLQSHTEAAAAQAAEQPVECDISDTCDQVLVHRLGNNQRGFSVRCVTVLLQMRQPSPQQHTRYAIAATLCPKQPSHVNVAPSCCHLPLANSHASLPLTRCRRHEHATNRGQAGYHRHSFCSPTGIPF